MLIKKAFDWLQTTQSTSGKHITPNIGGPIYILWESWSCGPTGWLALLLIIAGDVETNSGPTTTHKQVCICDICQKQIHGRKYRYGAIGLNTGCTKDAQVSA